MTRNRLPPASYQPHNPLEPLEPETYLRKLAIRANLQGRPVMGLRCVRGTNSNVMPFDPNEHQPAPPLIPPTLGGIEGGRVILAPMAGHWRGSPVPGARVFEAAGDHQVVIWLCR